MSVRIVFLRYFVCRLLFTKLLFKTHLVPMPLSDDETLNQILDHVLNLPADKRQAYINRVSLDNPILKQKLTVLLSGCETEVPDGFLNPSRQSAKLIEELYRKLKEKRASNK